MPGKGKPGAQNGMCEGPEAGRHQHHMWPAVGTCTSSQGKERKAARAVHRGPEFQAKCLDERLGRTRPWPRFSMERSS